MSVSYWNLEGGQTRINTVSPPKVPERVKRAICVGLIVGALVAGRVAFKNGYWKGKSECGLSDKDPSPNCSFSKAAVAADSGKCSEIGRDILQKGGSAVDAAIAALLCTSIINPQCMGIGGGVIFTVMDRSGKVKIITSRETVPRNVNSDLLKSCPKTTEWSMEWPQDSRWIGVPGEIRGYEAAHRLYGKLPWADLFQPAIKLAREGFPIPYYQGQHIPRIGNTSLRELYLDKNGNLLKTGDIVKFEKLADTLETIANEGPDVFYNGTIAKNLISDIQKAGGKLTLEDLASYEAKVTDAWNISLGEYRMYFPPPPSGGAILSFILNIMKGERPPSNMSPSVLKSQSKTLVIGGSGAETIPPAVASAVMNHLWFGKSLKEAIDTPVVLVDSQSEVKPEPKLEKDVVDGLEAKGHKIAKFYNTVNAVEKAGSCISAWSDERKKGKAAGY
ncbi:unnamed protein product [Oreochromis niloticus]|nr:unnamed protein product [Mustela putorius furo]